MSIIFLLFKVNLHVEFERVIVLRGLFKRQELKKTEDAETEEKLIT